MKNSTYYVALPLLIIACIAGAVFLLYIVNDMGKTITNRKAALSEIAEKYEDDPVIRQILEKHGLKPVIVIRSN